MEFDTRLGRNREGRRALFRGAQALPNSSFFGLNVAPLGSLVRVSAELDVLHVVSIAPPDALGRAWAAWQAGDAKLALATLAQERSWTAQTDPQRLAWRVRFAIDCADEGVPRHFAALLALPATLDLGEDPPGLLDLFGGLSPDLMAAVLPALAHRVAQLDLEVPAVRRLLDRMPEASWPLHYLMRRLRTGPPDGPTQREAKRRLGDTMLRHRDSLQRALLATVDDPSRPGRPRGARVAPTGSCGPRAASCPQPCARGCPPMAEGPCRTCGSARRETSWSGCAARPSACCPVRWPAPLPSRDSSAWDRRGLHEPLVRFAFSALVEALDDDELRRLLEALDQRLMGWELRRRLRRLREAEVPAAEHALAALAQGCHRIVFRGANPGRVCAWVLALHERCYGLLYEHDGTWVWVDGDADEVLASVPGRWLAAAAKVLG